MKKPYSLPIQLISTVFAALYVVFFIYSFIPSPQGSPMADHPYKPWDIEMILVKLLFVLFMTGYYYSWKSRLTAGILYLCWCVAVFADSVYIANLLHVSGDGILFIPPILLIALILLFSGLKEKKKSKNVLKL
jgi:hypothetical protein